jgi:hypothetical protein
MSRKKSRNHRRSLEYPKDLMIAGEDFQAEPGDPLVDAPSVAREGIDPKLLDAMREMFLPITVMVTPRMFGDEQRYVIVDGRRRVRHARVVNEELAARGEETRKLEVTLLHGDETVQFLAARAANRHGCAETHGQIADYVVWLRNRGLDDDAICRTLQIKASSLPHYALIADPQCIRDVRARLDEGLLPLQGASAIARLVPSQQGAALAALGDKKATATKARQAAAKAKGEQLMAAPGKRVIRRVLDSDGGKALPAEMIAAFEIAMGDRDPMTHPLLAAIWPESSKNSAS